MIPTLPIFSRALLTPDLSFRTLADACAETGNSGVPGLMRTTRFVEARIRWQGRRWLLSMPLTPSALPRIERTALAVKRFNTPALSDYRILPDELRWTDAAGQERSCDLVLQHLPEGRDFEEALLYESRDTLLQALDTLERELTELDFAHNGLKPENLRWSAGRFVPLRYHDARIGGDRGRDAEAIEALRRRITEQGATSAAHDVAAPYNPVRPLEGHRWTSHVFEGLVCVEDETGFGYVDTDNRPVIASRYLWADDFREGRAEVETPTGMGLIDREGNYVIPPEYEIVDYKPAESIVYVRKNGLWALFDYLGRQRTEFTTIDACKI